MNRTIVIAEAGNHRLPGRVFSTNFLKFSIAFAYAALVPSDNEAVRNNAATDTRCATLTPLGWADPPAMVPICVPDPAENGRERH